VAAGGWAVASSAGVREGTAWPADPPRDGLKSDWLRPSMLIARMHSRIQQVATITVILVKTSPALVPKALWPPMPPKAPARPPPLPRWISTSAIRTSAAITSRKPRPNLRNAVMGWTDSGATRRTTECRRD